MKKFIFSLLFLSCSAFANDYNEPLEPVDFVDAGRYVGRWYQIARNPLPFEPTNCVCTQQTLSLRPDGLVGVYNSCQVGSPRGPLVDIYGTATNDFPGENNRFTVDFNQGPKGQYWIIGLDKHYRWAVVSDPARRSLYILSKTPTLSKKQFKKALKLARKQVSTQNLLHTDQTGCSYPLN